MREFRLDRLLKILGILILINFIMFAPYLMGKYVDFLNIGFGQELSYIYLWLIGLTDLIIILCGIAVLIAIFIGIHYLYNYIFPKDTIDEERKNSMEKFK